MARTDPDNPAAPPSGAAEAGDAVAGPVGRGPAVRRVRKAYEQVYDQLRELILSGGIGRGERLPNEALLAREFGVSRGTIREALRLLAAQNLIRTAKGAGGGSFVTLPTVDHVSEFLRANIALLGEANDVTLDEFLEVRELLEVFAARQAAARHTSTHLEQLQDTIPHNSKELPVLEQFVHNQEFHTSVVAASGNALLRIAVQPIFSVLQANLTRRAELGDDFAERVEADHRAIATAIQSGDPDAAERAMRAHLRYLHDVHRDYWGHPQSTSTSTSTATD